MWITIQPLRAHAVISPESIRHMLLDQCDVVAPLIGVAVPCQRCSDDARCSSNAVDGSRRAVANLAESRLIKSVAASIQYGHFHVPEKVQSASQSVRRQVSFCYFYLPSDEATV